MSRSRVKPLVVFRKPKTCPVPIPPATVGILIIEYRVAGRRVAQSTGIRCAYKDWNPATNKVRGASRSVEADNDLLDSLLATAKDACRLLKDNGQPAVPARAKALALGGAADETLLTSWAAWGHRQHERAAAGEIQPDTAKLPARRLPLLTAWLTSGAAPAGLLTRELTAPLARAFARWLLLNYPTVKTQSFANKCARLLSECAACAVERGAVGFHPIGRLKLPKVKKKPMTFLSLEELAQLSAATFTSPGLRRTRDAFLLLCYTGFAWVDARAFDPARHIRTDKGGLRWVLRPRQKSDEDAHIALLPQAEALLDV